MEQPEAVSDERDEVSTEEPPLIADAVPFAAGVALIVAGAAGSAVMRKILPPEPNVATTGNQSG